MANVKISNLTAATTPVAGTEVLPIVQSGATVKVSIANLTAGRAVSVLSLTSTNDSTISGLTVGKGAGAVATNTAVGASALAGSNSGTGVNTAVGNSALITNSTGYYNTAIGAKHPANYFSALESNTTGNSNIAVGTAALGSNTTGSSNTALGFAALPLNTTASNNTAVGYQAGYTNSTGASNAFLGAYSGYATTGASNTFVGISAGEGVTTGAKNTILGRYNGNQGGLDIRTASNYIVLSDGDGNPRASWATSGTFTSRNTNGRNFQWDGSEVYIDVDNTVTLGFPSFRWTVVYATTGTINTSDANTKQDIAALDDAEKRVAIAIKSLIKKYRFKDAVAKKGDAARIHIGAVAQEVQAAFVAEGLDPARYALFCSDTWYEVDGKPASEASTPFTQNTPNAIEVTRLGIRYDELLAFVIAAL
jgi:hypothetical protein